MAPEKPEAPSSPSGPTSPCKARGQRSHANIKIIIIIAVVYVVHKYSTRFLEFVKKNCNQISQFVINFQFAFRYCCFIQQQQLKTTVFEMLTIFLLFYRKCMVTKNFLFLYIVFLFVEDLVFALMSVFNLRLSFSVSFSPPFGFLLF